MTLLHPWLLLLLTVLPGIFWFLRRADARRALAVRSFSPSSSAPMRSRAAIVLVALALIVVALTQPVWREGSGPATRSTPDVVFLLDVSRSMLTRDIGTASRLEQARAAIGEVMHYSAEQRLALVAFAGNASVECPLTNDYAFLRDQLKTTSRESVTLGGTRIGDAIRFAARTAFDDASRNSRVLVLLGDGGDDGSAPLAAAGELERRGIRLVIVGVGAASNPGLVPVSAADSSPYLYAGQLVRAPLDSGALQKLCAATAHCAYTGFPDTAMPKTILNGTSAVVYGKTGSAIPGALLSLSAAALLVWEAIRR